MQTKYPTRYINADIEKVEIPELKKMIVKIGKREDEKLGLFIHGESGTGKTYAVYALCKFLENKCSFKIENWIDLLNSVKKAIAENGTSDMQEMDKRRRFDGIYFIDDIGTENVTPYVIDMMYQLVNYRYNEMLPIVITTNLTKAGFAERYGDRIMSRLFEMCDVVELTGKDRRLS